uniref:LysM peptidoglycan-binding domain-containing protein n=1 Tax=Acetatifactor sp. TaxID=1872090 RepID=UPI0040569191
MKVQKNIYEMTDKELRIYKRRLHRQRAIRRRIMMVFATICLVMVCAISYHSIRTSANTGHEDLSFKYYTNITVAYGDTVWDLADDYIDYSQYEDKESYLIEVKSINHLDEELNIRAGQNLILPYYSNEFVK